jgi:hypothetical protein
MFGTRQIRTLGTMTAEQMARRGRPCHARQRLEAFMVKIVLSVPAALFLAGCAISPHFVQTGTAKSEVVARLGQPTGVYRLPDGGERLQYSLQPLGRTAWAVDLDGAGRVASTRQVLSEENFERIVPGQWTREDIQREFGPPALIDRVASWNGPVMTYRWSDVANTRMQYSIYLDANNIVRRAHPSPENLGGPNDKS